MSSPVCGYLLYVVSPASWWFTSIFVLLLRSPLEKSFCCICCYPCELYVFRVHFMVAILDKIQKYRNSLNVTSRIALFLSFDLYIFSNLIVEALLRDSYLLIKLYYYCDDYINSTITNFHGFHRCFFYILANSDCISFLITILISDKRKVLFYFFESFLL